MFCAEKVFCRLINENVPIEPFSYAYFSSAFNPSGLFSIYTAY